jgi:hypothetical protein
MTADHIPVFFKAVTTPRSFFIISPKYLYVVSTNTEYSLEACPIPTITTVIPK